VNALDIKLLGTINDLTEINSMLKAGEDRISALLEVTTGAGKLPDRETKMLRDARHNLTNVRTIVVGVRELVQYRCEEQKERRRRHDS